MNEKFAPELLESKADLVECMLDQIKEMVSDFNKLLVPLSRDLVLSLLNNGKNFTEDEKLLRALFPMPMPFSKSSALQIRLANRRTSFLIFQRFKIHYHINFM